MLFDAQCAQILVRDCFWEDDRLPELTLPLRRATAQQMPLIRLISFELAGAGNAKPLADALIRLHLGHETNPEIQTGAGANLGRLTIL
jgi:hypothetical protein